MRYNNNVDYQVRLINKRLIFMSAKNIGMIFGVIFIILGILGFVGGMGIVGPEGLFQTDRTHDIIHLVSGLIFLFVAMKSAGSMGMVLKVFGIIYLLVALLGFFTGDVLGLFEVSMADNVLHLVLAVIFLWAGFMGGRSNGMMNSGM